MTATLVTHSALNPAASSPTDTLRTVETPEGIELQLRPAGLPARGMALLLDIVLEAVIGGGAYFLLSLLGKGGAGLGLIALFVIQWFYPVLFEMFNRGRTPGKVALNLQVVHDDGTPISWTSSVLRNLLRYADMLPVGYGVGAIAMLSNQRFQRLGDLAAGTLVVYQHEQLKPAALPDGDPLPPSHALHTDEQRAIVDFAERSGQLNPARQDELAALLEPLATNRPNVETLLANARWFRGHSQPTSNDTNSDRSSRSKL